MCDAANLLYRITCDECERSWCSSSPKLDERSRAEWVFKLVLKNVNVSVCQNMMGGPHGPGQ